MKTDAGTISCLGLSLRREQLKQVAKDREYSRIPACAHDGWNARSQSYLMDLGLVLPGGLTLKLSAFDDRFAVLEHLVCDGHDEVRR